MCKKNMLKKSLVGLFFCLNSIASGGGVVVGSGEDRVVVSPPASGSTESSEIKEDEWKRIFEKYRNYEYQLNSGGTSCKRPISEEGFEPFAIGDERFYSSVLKGELAKDPAVIPNPSAFGDCIPMWSAESLGEAGLYGNLKLAFNLIEVQSKFRNPNLFLLGEAYRGIAMTDPVKGIPFLRKMAIDAMDAHLVKRPFVEFLDAIRLLKNGQYDFYKPLLRKYFGDEEFSNILTSTFKSNPDERIVPYLIDLVDLYRKEGRDLDYLPGTIVLQVSKSSYAPIYRLYKSETDMELKSRWLEALLAIPNENKRVIPEAIAFLEKNYGLSQCSYPRCVLSKALEYSDASMAMHLGMTNDPRVANVLASLLIGSDSGTRMVLLAGVKTFDNSIILDALRWILKNKMDDVRESNLQTASKILAEFGDRSDSDLVLAAYKGKPTDPRFKEDPKGWFEAFATFGDKQFVPILENELKNGRSVGAAGKALAKIVGISSEAEIKNAIKRKNIRDKERLTLYEVLQRLSINPFENFEATIAVVNDIWMKRQLIEIYGRQNSVESNAYLSKLAADPSYFNRSAAVCSMAQGVDGSKIALFERVARTEPYWYVRRCAVEALIEELKLGNESVRGILDDVSKTDPNPILRKKSKEVL